MLKGKPKEIRFNKALKPNHRFQYHGSICISARLMLCELLLLSKETREVLKESLIDGESFVTLIPLPSSDNMY